MPLMLPMEHHLTSEQIEAEICGIIRDVAHKHGAEVKFNFDVPQAEEGLRLAVQYDVTWKYRRHLKGCVWAIVATLAIHWICAGLYWLRIAPYGVFLTSMIISAIVPCAAMIYALFFAPKRANPDRIYREARSLVRKKFGKTYNAGLNDLT